VIVAEERGQYLFAAVVDVLGHGVEAHADAQVFEREIRRRWTPGLEHMLTGLHGAVSGSRGAAVTLCCLEISSGKARTLTVGNTALRLIGREVSQTAVAVDGTVGHRLRTPIIQELTLTAETVLIMHSDGIRSSLNFDDYPQLSYQSAQAISNTILRRFSRPYDDASCIVIRYQK
jgi:hypothetical protein